jgi:hypothetical protein
MEDNIVYQNLSIFKKIVNNYLKKGNGSKILKGNEQKTIEVRYKELNNLKGVSKA